MLKSESFRLKEKIGDLPKGVIHGDLFPDNMIGTDDEVVSLLDFEEVCYGIFLKLLLLKGFHFDLL